MSIPKCMQFHASYHKESSNEHKFIYDDLYTIV